MTCWTALTTLGDKTSAEALGLALEKLEPEPTGVGVFEIEDGSGTWEVGGYFVEQPDDIALDLLAAVHDAKAFVVSKVPDKDWVAEVRRELSPISAGRFFLYGAHDADKVPNRSVPLLIEAAMAFGTGHHGTTKGCLLEYEKYLNAGQVPKCVLDLGCGTAVLAMAAAKTSDAVVFASDIDDVATATARANAEVNEVADRMTIVTAAGLDHPELKAAGAFDLVFANILKGPLIDLAPVISAAVTNYGKVILSGILFHQLDEIVKIYENQRFKVVSTCEMSEWVALTMAKMP
ncbi:MAG: 50S ribosomal protein L11 methyltransferase [Pseudomonadota bacterium]